MFQGDGAREYLLHSMKEEARYQKEVLPTKEKGTVSNP